MKKNRAEHNDWNLYNLNRPLYDIIMEYGISHTFLAKLLYPKEWAEAENLDKKEENGKKTYNVHKLTGKLRNRLDGRGKLTMDEYKALIDVFDSMLKDLQDKVTVAKKKYESQTKVQRSETIKNILERLDAETLAELKRNL